MDELQLDVQGKHELQISPSAKIHGRIRVRDNAGPCSVRIADGVTGKWNLNVSGGASVVIGEGTTCETTMIVAQGGDVRIGRDCMFSFAVEIRTTDTHAIYDVDSGERVNLDKPISIGDHVWLGKQVMVLKGASIGAGCIVGVRAVVSAEIPPLSVCVGAPARVVRSNATWTRHIGKGRLEGDQKALAAITEARRR